METSEVLDRAADLIEERGWMQGAGWIDDLAYTHDTFPLCLEGGIQAAMGGLARNAWDPVHKRSTRPLETCPAYVAVRRYLDGEAPYYWNDEPFRTATEVIEVLRACAVIEAAREREAVPA